MALGRLDSGIGMITSIWFGGTVETTRLASVSPRFRRAWYTEMPSSTESGRARYTNSKMHGLSDAPSAHCIECTLPSRSMNTASPGSMLRSNTWPEPSSATDSLATMTVPSALRPMHSGRMP
ncbi:hypothetical protein D9M69_561680 [compost metagenome]